MKREKGPPVIGEGVEVAGQGAAIVKRGRESGDGRRGAICDGGGGGYPW